MTIDVDTTVKGIAARKALVFKAGPGPNEKVKTTLTPVGTEKGSRTTDALAQGAGIPDVPEVFLTNEAVTDISRDLRRQAGILLSVADGLDAMTGREAEPDRSAAIAVTKAAEEGADARHFAKQYAEQQRAAQQATYKPDAEVHADNFVDLAAEAARIFAGNIIEAEATTSGSTEPGWVCPAHGDMDIADLQSKRGRKYRACKVCSEFEK